jgi:hypothetical protein
VARDIDSGVIDVSALQMVLAVLTGWLDRKERQALAYLMEENRVLRRQLGQRRLQFTDADRRRLAVRGHRLGRRVLRQIASVVTPDTILRWHRQLIVRKWTYSNKRSDRHGVLTEIRRLVVRMAEDNPTWGYTRIQGALTVSRDLAGSSSDFAATDLCPIFVSVDCHAIQALDTACVRIVSAADRIPRATLEAVEES